MALTRVANKLTQLLHTIGDIRSAKIHLSAMRRKKYAGEKEARNKTSHAQDGNRSPNA